MEKLQHCDLTWDEPKGCSTPRGWLHMENHPDNPNASGQSTCCGNYLDYSPIDGSLSRGPNGETVHASAYFFHYPRLMPQRTIRLGAAWFATIAEAKDFIENNVRAYFGVSHPGNVYVGPDADAIDLGALASACQ